MKLQSSETKLKCLTLFVLFLNFSYLVKLIPTKLKIRDQSQPLRNKITNTKEKKKEKCCWAIFDSWRRYLYNTYKYISKSHVFSWYTLQTGSFKIVTYFINPNWEHWRSNIKIGYIIILFNFFNSFEKTVKFSFNFIFFSFHASRH